MVRPQDKRYLLTNANHCLEYRHTLGLQLTSQEKLQGKYIQVYQHIEIFTRILEY